MIYPRIEVSSTDPSLLSMEVNQYWCPLLFLPFPCYKANCPIISILATWTQKGVKDRVEEGSKKQRRRDTGGKFYKKHNTLQSELCIDIDEEATPSMDLTLRPWI